MVSEKVTITKPTIVVLPGAWHVPDCFDLAADGLREKGYEVVSLHLPSIGHDNNVSDHNADAAVIQQTVTKLADEGKDILLIMHSYSGVPGTESAKGLLKKDRKLEGKKGGIVGLFYQSAFIVPEGESVASALGAADFPDWIKIDGANCYVSDGATVFYDGLPASEADALSEKLLPHALSTFASPLKYAAYKYAPTTYLFTENDNAVTYTLQKRLVASVEESCKETGNLFNKVTLPSGHSPHLTMPGKLVSAIRRAAGEIVVE